MKIHNPNGSKERLKEMFERVNKVTLNETFDIPVVNDKAYLDKTGDDAAEKEQKSSKYDGGVDYPAIDDLKTDHESLDKLAEEEELDEISMAGLKGVGKHIGGSISNTVNKGVEGVKNYAGDLKKTYHKNTGNSQLGKIQKYATNFGEKFGKYLVKYNEQAVKAGEQELQPRQIGMVILNALDTAYKSGGSADINLDRLKMQKESEDYEEIEGGLGDDSDPNEFDHRQVMKGMEIEMEHTDDPRQALEITMDHLMEIPNYYDELEDMESESGVEAEEDMGDDSASALLDPSQHWVDDYSPKKLGDEAEMTDDINEEELADTWAKMAGVSRQDWTYMPYEKKMQYINKYYQENPQQNNKDPYGGDPEGVAKWLEKDKAAGRSPMDENATEMSFNDDGRGNWIPQGMEDKKIAIRKVQQPMGSGNEKYLLVQLDQNGGVVDIYDKKDSWEEAVAALGASIS